MASFSQLVSNYLGAHSGHTILQGPAESELTKRLNLATVSEINEEYNYLTFQKFWTRGLMDMFYDELRDRVYTQTVFTVVVYKGDKKSVTITAGFDEQDLSKSEYRIPYMDRDFRIQTQGRIISLIINSEKITAQLDQWTSELVALLGSDKVVILDNKRDTIEVEVNVEKSPQFKMLSGMYQGVRSGKPAVYDLELT